MLGQYLRGQLLVMLMLAVFYSVGLALFGFDLAVPIGVFTGLAMFVPYVGFGIGLVARAARRRCCSSPAGTGLLAVAVVYGIGQIVEGFFLTPRLVGERIGLQSADGHLRAARVRPPVRFCRRADRAAGQRRCCVVACAGCARATRRAAVPGLTEPMKQIPLAIGPEPVHTFENFLPGANGAALAHLLALAPARAAGLSSGAADGSGKTHLLHARAPSVRRRTARSVGWFDADCRPPPWQRGRAGRCSSRRRAAARRGAAARGLRARSSKRRPRRSAIVAAGGVPPVDLHAARRPAHPPRLGPCLRAAAAGRARGARRAAARGRPARHLSFATR